MILLSFQLQNMHLKRVKLTSKTIIEVALHMIVLSFQLQNMHLKRDKLTSKTAIESHDIQQAYRLNHKICS